MDMSNSTYILGIVVAIILAAALVVFILWLLCPSSNGEDCDTSKSNCGWSGSNTTACADPPKTSCGWSGSNTAADCNKTATCKTQTCGGLSGSSTWSGGVWPQSGDWFSGKVGVKEVDC